MTVERKSPMPCLIPAVEAGMCMTSFHAFLTSTSTRNNAGIRQTTPTVPDVFLPTCKKGEEDVQRCPSHHPQGTAESIVHSDYCKYQLLSLASASKRDKPNTATSFCCSA